MSHLRQFVNFYSIRLRTRHTRNDHDFSELDGKNSPLPDILAEFKSLFDDLKKRDRKDTTAKTTTKLIRMTFDKKARRFYGIIEHGKYGVRGSLLDLDTSARSNIKQTHSPMYGFYFQIYLPTTGTKGLIALHSRGKAGCKTALTDAIREHFKKKCSNTSIFINPVNIDFEDRDHFFSSYKIKKLRFITFEPKRLDQKVLGRTLRPEERVTVDRSVQIGRHGNSLISFPAFVKNPLQETKAFVKRYVELPEQGLPTQIHVTIEMNGQQKTIRLDQPNPQFDVSLDITEELPESEQHDPAHDALHKACSELLNDAIENIIGD